MEKKIFTLGAIILATGVMLNTIYNISPKPVEGRQDLYLILIIKQIFFTLKIVIRKILS